MTETLQSAVTEGYELADRFRVEQGRVFLSGVQAMARLPIDQLRIDRRQGLSTAAFVSGYQGSPVGTFHEEVERAHRTCADLPIIAQRGVNEELAAAAVMGSQLTATLSDCLYDGVLGVWYGKSPGVDRASDAIRHAVFAGTFNKGGVVAVVGDDPSAKSSTLPSSSVASMADLHMPVLYPGDAQEAIDLARHAVALSRASGLWAGIRLVTPVADGTATVDIDPARVAPLLPMLVSGDSMFAATPSGHLLAPRTLEMEREVFEVRSEIAVEYGRLNALNRATVRGPSDWIGIVAPGHTYFELREALQTLGLRTDQDLKDVGIRLIQLSMPYPLDSRDVRDFAAGLEEVLVLEEKAPALEHLVRDALYDLPDRPKVWGKRDRDGNLIVPFHSLLDADRLAPVLRHHLGTRLSDRLAPARQRPDRQLIPLTVSRAPFFCSGCPHNTSTRVEAGTRVGGGIGCHGMIALMDPARTGEIVSLTAMGNEGAQWIGMAPFLANKHLIQNLGDGTFFHSGSLAIRAAVASGVDITYKLLYNGTVAMTGGQDAQGSATVPEIASMLLAEGVKRIIITSDDPKRHPRSTIPTGVEVWDRSRIAEAQRTLAKIPGTTILIHDQPCAAETRRARSRGKLATPNVRVVINERICEGCGDCGDKSNCLSVQPVGTPFGRKTTIHQSSCNLDVSCLKGDCPAFATVSISPDQGARRDDRVPPPDLSQLPDPVPIVDADDFTVRMSGIGGTGVVTVSQIIGTAAMLDGRHVRGLDQTGLSQKAGPVVSDVRVSRHEPAASNNANASGVDCFLAFDLLAAASDAHREGAVRGRTVVVGSLELTPTGAMVVNPNAKAAPRLADLYQRLDDVSRPDANRYLDTAGLTTGLFGGTMAANILTLGVAVQIGALPLSPQSFERAIELNGVAIELNIAAFRYGRLWAERPAVVERVAGIANSGRESVHDLIARLGADLDEYQNKEYGTRFRNRIAQVLNAEQRTAPSSVVLTETAARSLHKLMAYKDEYEVARLALLPESQSAYRLVGGPGTRITYHLHPPMLRYLGVDRKIGFRRSAGPTFQTLRSLRRVRGTKLDPFGSAQVRRVERAMIPEFETALDTLISKLTTSNLDQAIEIAGLPDQVRGYEDLKLRRAERYREQLTARIAEFA